MNIPFVDLNRETLIIKDLFQKGLDSILENSNFVGGSYIADFEERFSIMHEFDKVISCGNGTDAIMIALRALGIRPGDEVIVPAQTWISTASAVNAIGAKPVFCDIDQYNCIDPQHLKGVLTEKTRAIIAVHLYGMPAKMDDIVEFCKLNNLFLIEDCAQAHLAKYNSNLIGTFGDVATFSFYPSKNLGAFGDAGCMCTNNSDLANKLLYFARHGGPKKGDHRFPAYNSRMDPIQALVLCCKMDFLESWTHNRRLAANYYIESINNPLIELPKIRDLSNPAWHLFVIQTNARDNLKVYLDQNNISTAIQYPRCLPALEAYGENDSEFPNAARQSRRILSLPMFSLITENELNFVCEALNDFKG
jgi:dTDP-4-amino-4,6-dideoxygalactose transaminase